MLRKLSVNNVYFQVFNKFKCQLNIPAMKKQRAAPFRGVDFHHCPGKFQASPLEQIKRRKELLFHPAQASIAAANFKWTERRTTITKTTKTCI